MDNTKSFPLSHTILQEELETAKTVAEHYKLQAHEAAEAMADAQKEIAALHSIIDTTKQELYEARQENNRMIDLLNRRNAIS